MKSLGIFYATRHGHARRVAWHVGEYFRTRGFDADVWSVLDVPEGLDLGRYAAIVVAASVHAGHHEPEMVRFVRRHLRVGSSRVDLQACKLEYSIVSPK